MELNGVIRTDRQMADGRTIRYYDSKPTERNAVDQRPKEEQPGIGELHRREGPRGRLRHGHLQDPRGGQGEDRGDPLRGEQERDRPQAPRRDGDQEVVDVLVAHRLRPIQG